MQITKRFQVFVSSTYTDLVDERREIIQALLELDCIPSGMELFQAADDDSWSLIRSVIDDCDYYIVVLAGRYGTEHPDTGISYTEMEYRYAIEKGIPTIAFLHENISTLPSSAVDSGERAKKLLEFRILCEKKQVKFWNGAQNLGSLVSRSIIRLIKERPAVGWVRADLIASDEAREQILKLKEENESLKLELSSAKSVYQGDITKLAQGDDAIEITWAGSYQKQSGERWNQNPVQGYIVKDKIVLDALFKKISPRMVDEISERELRQGVNNYFGDEFFSKKIKFSYTDHHGKDHKIDSVLKSITCTDDSFQILKVQFMALNLIERGKRRRPPSDKASYWKLTDEGEIKMMGLIAIPRDAGFERSS